MNIAILGIDGYLGWSLAQYLAKRGHQVSGVDSYLRRHLVEREESQSAIPIYYMPDRREAFMENFGHPLFFARGNITDYRFISDFLEIKRPEVIVHLAEIPSAPYSMKGVYEACSVYSNNVIGTLKLLYAMKEHVPDAHLIKLGTMGEYGTPNIDISEGKIPIEYKGRVDMLQFPKQPGSYYHATKVYDSIGIEFACKNWGLRSTDIMQGIVYGTRIDEMGDDLRLRTRFDFDQSFGTIANRFCAQAVIGEPLTVYGTGQQRRGLLPIKDSMECLRLAIENPPKEGEYRIFNQFESTHSVFELASEVQDVAFENDIKASIKLYENPRNESEDHYYNPEITALPMLGYKPEFNIRNDIKNMINDLISYKDRIIEKKDVLIPDIRWNGNIEKVKGTMDG